jgi:hypothetical protein
VDGRLTTVGVNSTASIATPTTSRAGVLPRQPKDVSAAVSLSVRHRQIDPSLSAIAKVALRCDIPRCKSRRTFKSSYELARHERTQHGDKHFVCDAHGCFQGQLPRSFARPDKLTSHIKALHGQQTVFAKCPIADCNFGSCTLDVLGVHIQRLHPDDEYGRAVLNATSCKTLRCPLWHCGKHCTAKKMLQHITSHAKEEIEAANPSLQLMGLLVQSVPGYAVTIQVICPACRTASASMEHFIRHLSTFHLCTPQSGGSKHFEQWKAYLLQNLDKYRSSARVNKLTPWSSLEIATLSAKRGFRCPSCPFSVAGVGGYGSDQADKERAIKEHHLSLLRPEAEVVKELYPHRMQILRLWPEFVTHPVFADFDQPRKQSESGPSQAQPSLPGHVHDAFEIPDWTAHDFVPQPAFANLDQPQGGPSEVQPSFSEQFNENFWNTDWTTYDFNASM